MLISEDAKTHAGSLPLRAKAYWNRQANKQLAQNWGVLPTPMESIRVDSQEAGALWAVFLRFCWRQGLIHTWLLGLAMQWRWHLTSHPASTSLVLGSQVCGTTTGLCDAEDQTQGFVLLPGKRSTNWAAYLACLSSSEDKQLGKQMMKKRCCQQRNSLWWQI